MTYKMKKNENLTNIFGIGKVMANKLGELGIHTVVQLRECMDKVKLTKNQKIGLIHFEDLLQRIPRSEIEIHRDFIMGIAEDIKVEIVGSYRRGKETTRDIDVLFTCDDAKKYEDILDKLIAAGYITDTLSIGKKKFMGVCILDGCPHRRIDITLATEDEYSFALLHLTGSKETNIKMSITAGELGYVLNERGIRSGDNFIEGIKTEEDIFAILSMDYLPPELR